MSKFQHDNDPHKERESERYENPIPSREHILSYLEKQKAPGDFISIKKDLKLKGDAAEVALSRRLNAMERDGQLMRDRKGRFALINHLDLKQGRVEGHRDGFGFVLFDDKTEDWFLSPRQMQATMHGDIVLVRLKGENWKGKTEAAIVKVLKSGIERVVGRYHLENHVEGHTAFVVADDGRITQDIQIPPNQSLQPSEGQIVVTDITRRPGRHSPPVGNILEILGDHMDPGMEIDVAIRGYDIPHQWPDNVLEQVNQLTPKVSDSDKKGRIDLRKLPLVTIDGSDARDFDDAVHCVKEDNGDWRLWVAIADVSHYVRPGNALDEEAFKRGNSVYFPGHVVPMLPEILSNGLCSLNPDVDRLCMVSEMTISNHGKLKGYQFYPALMRSHGRLTYDQVSAVLEGDVEARSELQPLVSHLEELHRLYKQLIKTRKKRGAIDFDTTETRIEFTAERKISQIVPVTRNDAHRLIEECMILANVSAARYFIKKKAVGIYRIHDGPRIQRLESLRAYLGLHGLGLEGGDEPVPEDYQKLLNQVADRPDAEQIQIMLLRSFSQAVYSPDNIGHFGLALPAYTHFTSPIRRYPDLLVHRTIKALLQKEGAELCGIDSGRSYSLKEMTAQGEHSVITERRADEATRQVVTWLKCEFMLEKVDQEFSGKISAVSAFGIFVRLDDIYVEGLVHVTALNNDYYHFDRVTQQLSGERTGQVLRMGDKIRIKVVAVNLDERKIDFECVSHEMTGPKSRVVISNLSDGKKKSKTAKNKKQKSSKSEFKPVNSTGNSTGNRTSKKKSKTTKKAAKKSKDSTKKKVRRSKK